QFRGPERAVVSAGEFLAGLFEDECGRTAAKLGFYQERPLAADIVGKRRYRDQHQETHDADGFKHCQNVLSARSVARGFHRDSYLSVRPAALETAAAITGPVVGNHAQDVLARLTEGRGRPRFPGELRRRRSREFGFLYHRPRVGELDRTWPTQHAPGNRHSRRSRTSPGQRRRSIIGNPHSQIERLGQRRRDRLGLTGGTLHPWTAF